MGYQPSSLKPPGGAVMWLGPDNPTFSETRLRIEKTIRNRNNFVVRQPPRDCNIIEWMQTENERRQQLT